MGQRLVIIKLLSANSKKQFSHTQGTKVPIQRCRAGRYARLASSGMTNDVIVPSSMLALRP